MFQNRYKFWIIISSYYILYFRDFKPQNLLLFQDGSIIKIADMGISRVSTNQSMTEFTGTQLYISPGKKIELTLYLLSQLHKYELQNKSSFLKIA